MWEDNIKMNANDSSRTEMAQLYPVPDSYLSTVEPLCFAATACFFVNHFPQFRCEVYECKDGYNENSERSGFVLS